MNNVGMAGAVALVGVGLITIGLGNFVNTPQAVAAAPVVAVEAGPEEATIVWFGVTGSETQNENLYVQHTYHRLWSDGRIELRRLMTAGVGDLVCYKNDLVRGLCANDLSADTGWIEVPAPPGGEGFACRADTNGDRRVDGVDLATVLAQWGDGVSCDPQPSYPCFDLGNLGLPAGGI